MSYSYSIEPLNAVGSNLLGRTIAEKSGVNLKNIQIDNLEETLRSLPSLDIFSLTAELPIPLKATVTRKLDPNREIVRLSSGAMRINLFRDVHDNPGDISVSCEPEGDEVPVETINIEFRRASDIFTDRGLVWVYPGSPATFGFAIKSQALKTPGAVKTIVVAAEEAVIAKVLKHFQ